MARKTIEVQVVHQLVNTALATSDSTLRLTQRDGTPYTPEQAFRLGICSVLEQILHRTENYRGFQYNASEFVMDRGHSVLRPGYDESRRHYL